MKKSYKIVLLFIISLGLMSLNGCSKEQKNAEDIDNIDVSSNLVLDIEDNEIKYKTLDNGKLVDLDIKSKDNLQAFNESKDILIFSRITEDNKKEMDIVSKGNKKTIDVEGYLDMVLISSNGSYTLYKTSLNGISVDYYIINNKTFEKKKLRDDILISGEMIKFLDNENIIFYGVDIKKKESGLYVYNIVNDTYTLKKKIMGGVISYLEVLDKDNVVYVEGIDEESKLISFNVSNKKAEVLTSKFKYIEDSILYKDKLYLSAAQYENLDLYSLDLKSKELKRLTFDFPKSLARTSSLIEENGEIYFSDVNGKIYKYDTIEKSTSIMDNKNGIYLIKSK